MLSCPELLSPAGSLEALKYAVMYGADAVYCALPRFGMRAAPVNLTIGELHDGCIFAHARGKKVYLTLNNLPTNDELSELPQYIKDAAEAGVDAFIIADLGVLSLAKQYAPDVDVHFSTQAGITNYAAATMAYNLGAKRVVLARELTLTDIAQIRDRLGKHLRIHDKRSHVAQRDAAGENITPQTYQWPLQQSVSFTLPKGDYKAVFVGNVDKNLFAEQNDNAILTDYQGDMANARINMPEKGPLGFNQYNMYYLCVVDFSQANPSPNVLMQRIMANNVYGRNMVDTQNEKDVVISMLVNNLVKEIRQNDLTTDVVKALLHSSLLNALSKATDLDAIAGGLTHVVDRLVNLLLGDVVEKLNEVLLKEVTKRLSAALEGEAKPNTNLAG